MISRNMAELKHALRYAQSLIEATLDPWVTISPEGKVNDVNEAMVKVTGVLCEALIGTDFSQYFTEPDKAHEGVLGVVAVARDVAELRQQRQLSEQLQGALESRIVIEQAKGITAQRRGVTIDHAYQRISAHARKNNASLRTVAEAIVEVGLQV